MQVTFLPTFKSTFFILMFSCCFPSFLFSQIEGSIVNERNEKLSFATIVLTKDGDSTVVKGTITDDNGYFMFEQIPKGKYILTCSYIGYKPESYFVDIDTINKHTQIKIILNEGLSQLDGIEITAFKNIVKRDNNKLVFDTQNLKKNSGDALSLLEVTPGVILNKGNQLILINGRGDIGIMLNGKFLGNSIEAAFQVLSSVSSEDIIRIEVIDNPSVEYSSHGSALLNIVTKEQSDELSNISLNGNLGYGNGKKIYLNLGGFKDFGKVYTAISYAYGLSETNEIWRFSRTVEDDISFNHSNRMASVFNHSMNVDVVYEIDSSTTIGANLSGFVRQWDMLAINETNSSIEDISYNVVSYDNEMDRWDNYMSSIYLNKKVNKRTNANIGFDYLRYKNRNDHDYANTFEYPDNTTLEEEVILRKETPINVLVANLGLNTYLSTKLNLSGGFRFSRTNFTNVFESRNPQDNSKNAFENTKISESIYGSWLTSSYKKNQIQAELGVRMEHTLLTVENNATDDILVDSRFTDFFPFLSFTYKVSKQTQISSGYNRRISRQPYTSLAPFVVYQGPDVIYTGNVLLSPAYSNNFFFDFNFADYSFSLKYKTENNTIEKYQPFLNEDMNLLEVKPLNYEKSKKLSLSATKSFILLKRLRFQLNSLLMWDYYKDSKLYNETILFTNLALSTNGIISLALAKGYDFQISANFRTPMLTGFNLNTSPGFVNFTTQKQLGSFKITFSIEDIFSSNNWSIRSDLNRINAAIRSDYLFENPIVKIGILYDLRKIKSKRESFDGPEEKKRL